MRRHKSFFLLIGISLFISAAIPFDARIQNPIQTIPVGRGPVGIAFDGAHIWVANELSGDVYKIHAATGTVMQTLATGPGAQYLAFDGTNIWVTNCGTGSVTKIDADTGTIIGNYPIGVMPDGLGVDGTFVWVADYVGGSVVKLQAATGAVVQTIPLGTHPRFVAFDGAYIWVTVTGDNKVVKLRPSTGEIVGTWTLGFPYAIVFDGKYMWITCGTENAIAKIDADMGTIVGVYPTGIGPNWIAFDGASIWTSNQSSNTISQHRAGDGSLVGTYSVGRRPQCVASDGSNMWVANGSDNSVSVLSFPCAVPSIPTPPASQTITSGSTATLTVVASGVTPFTYQWYEGESGDTAHPIGNGSISYTTSSTGSNSFTISPIHVPTGYWVRVGNSCGHADSGTAVITVTGGASPTISDITSTTGKAGGSAEIIGTGFTAESDTAPTVYFGALKATVREFAATELTVTIPKNCPPGLVDVYVVVNHRKSNIWAFTVK